MENNSSVHTLLTHEVENFDSWKQGFDAHGATREQHGLRAHGLYQATDNPNMVTVHMEFPSMDVMQQFMSNANFQESMKKAGVKGQPEVKMLRKHS